MEKLRNLNYSVILACSAILFLFILVWWLFRYEIPEMIPYTPIRPFGLAWLLFLVLLFSIAFKYLLNKTDYSTIELTLHGTGIILISELIFQPVRLSTFDGSAFGELGFIFFRSTALASIFGSGIAFLVAKKLKTGKVGKEIFYFILILMGIGMLMKSGVINIPN